MSDDEDEELSVGREHKPGRLQRPAMVVLVAIAGLGAAYVVNRAGGNERPGGSGSPSASASGSVSASPSPSAASSALTSLTVVPGSDVVPLPLPSATRVPICPSGARCVSSGALPAGVPAALRERYPGARITSARTVTAIGGGNPARLLQRSIKAVAGARRLDITVTPFVLGPDDFSRDDRGSVSQVMVESTGSGKTVTVLLREPRVARPNDLIVLRLARDPRLGALT